MDKLIKHYIEKARYHNRRIIRGTTGCKVLPGVCRDHYMRLARELKASQS